jgi:hypothetical protein
MLNNFSAMRIHPYFLSFKRPAPHSKFSPSSADRWLITGCSFSTEFIESKQIPEEQTDYSRGGTLAHSLSEAMYRQEYYGLPIPESLLIEIAMWDKYQAEQGKPGATEEMFRCAREYVDVISYWLNNKELVGDVIHFGLEMATPVFPDEGCFGTSDCIIIGTKAAVVIDFKYGVGKVVAANSPQLKVYAAGISRWLDNVPQGYVVHAVVFQPRVTSAPKETHYTMPDLHQFLGTIWQSIQESKRKDLVPCQGNHCYWCPAKRTKDPSKQCPTIEQNMMALANERFADFLGDMNAPVESITAPNLKRDAAILKLHSLYPMIKNIVESTSDEIRMRLLNGEVVNGFYLKDEYSKREIVGTTPEEKAGMIKGRFPHVDPWKLVPAEYKLKTITEIEKDIGKNKLDVICTRPITKKVDILDDRMNAILGDLAIFGQMTKHGEGQEE